MYEVTQQTFSFKVTLELLRMPQIPQLVLSFTLAVRLYLWTEPV